MKLTGAEEGLPINKKRKRLLLKAAEGVCYLIVIVCAVWHLINLFMDYHSMYEYKRIRQQVSQAREEIQRQIDEAKLNEEKADLQDIQKDTEDFVQNVFKERTINDILPEYLELYQQNPDFAAWIEVDDTPIAYPCMQGEDNEYYLTHNTNREYNKNGSIIMDNRCSFNGNSPQCIFYGHNVRDGNMFGVIMNYKDVRYFYYHPVIHINSLYEYHDFEVYSVFQISYEDAREEFPFYEYVDFTSEEEFDSYIEKAKEYSIYDTGVIPKYRERLALLMTCEHDEEDGRFVVLAVESSGEGGMK